MNPADLAYYGLSAALALILASTAFQAFRQGTGKSEARLEAGGIGAAAVGLGLVLVSGVVLNYLRPVTGDLFFQQVHFPVFYVGFSGVLLGATLIAQAVTRTMPRWVLAAIWAAYLTTVPIAELFLAQAGQTFVGGHVPELRVYFMPIFFALVASMLGLVTLTSWGRAKPDRGAVPIWFAAMTGFAFLGVLREATIIPSSENPAVDVVAAFGPFALAGLCLWQAQRSLGNRAVDVSRPRPPVTG